MSDINTPEEVLAVIRSVLCREEEDAIEETARSRAAEGWANPILQTQAEWQGHDSQIVFGTFAAAVADLVEYGQVPAGCSQPEDRPTDSAAAAEYLARALATYATIGHGEPLAYLGTDGCWILVRRGANRADIVAATVSCLPGE